MNESECATADWRMIGLEDGMAGKTTAQIGEHRRACAKHNITPNLDMYTAGHQQGVKTFCLEANGFKFGHSGGSYNGICPDHLAQNFLIAL